MSDSFEDIEDIFKTGYHHLKQNQKYCRTYKDFLEKRLRFLQALLDELQAVEKILSDISIQAEGQSSHQSQSSETETEEEDADIPDKLTSAINKLSDCEDSIEGRIDNSSRVLRIVMMQLENVAEDIENISNKILKAQNGDEPISSSEA